MVVFYKESPEYQYQDAKYIWYMPLFEEISDQKTRIVSHGSNGWGAENGDTEEVAENEDSIKNFLYSYDLDGETILSIKNVILTLNYGRGKSESYNFLDNPDNVRLASDDACVMKLKDEIVWNEDGTPNIDMTPIFHTVRCMFDSLPSDNISYTIDIIGADGEVVKTQSDKIKLVPAPWEDL